jgi:hypothetical protein
MIGFFKGVLIVLNILSAFYLVAFFTAEFVIWCRGEKYEEELYDTYCLPKSTAVSVILTLLAISIIFLTVAQWKNIFG